ncbi:MAG: phage tail length tape measure family protein, partial [Sphingopyxis sp.]|nr:phage tail length tape measure family protein [Sphingopyxis sp.]
MSEMILAVRITADGAQLVGQLTKAQTEALGLKRALDETATGSNNASRASDNLARSQREQAAAARAAAAEQKRAAQDVSSSLARQRQGYQQVGFQAQDFFTQIAAGTSPMQAFSQQSGQMAQSLQILGGEAQGGKGKMASFASFLAGPWGIALGVALPLVGLLANELFRTAGASDQAREASTGLSEAQSVLGNIFDLTTGKIRLNTSALDDNTQAAILNAQAKALEFRVQAQEARDRFA